MNVGEVFPRRIGVWALVAALLAGPFGPAAQLHAEAGDDPACASPATAAAEHAPPGLSAPGARPGNGHCAVCHWLHALRWTTLATTPTTADDTASRSLELLSQARSTPGTSLRLAARSPPATTSC